MSNLTLTPSPQSVGQPETIRVNLAKGSINFDVSVITFKDKDTNQIVQYIPALEVSAYGETEDKAQEMLKVVTEEMMEYLVSLSYKKMVEELRDLGFEQTPMKNKEFSKAYVDGNGDLQNLNAVENSIKRTNYSIAA